MTVFLVGFYRRFPSVEESGLGLSKSSRVEDIFVIYDKDGLPVGAINSLLYAIPKYSL